MPLQILSAAGTVISVLIGAAALGLVVFVMIRHVVRKKQGKSDCGCDCSSCGCCCSSCVPKEKEQDK